MTELLVCVYFIIGLITTAMCPEGKQSRAVEVTIDTILGLFWPVVVIIAVCYRIKAKIARRRGV